ncbi:hypothetical protein F5B21DRAFT_521107 [Xylaria acuta]|nr:hypothetical protein F5B21DRAFT_521107 [Xylaria acuta]
MRRINVERIAQGSILDTNKLFYMPSPDYINLPSTTVNRSEFARLTTYVTAGNRLEKKKSSAAKTPKILQQRKNNDPPIFKMADPRPDVGPPPAVDPFEVDPPPELPPSFVKFPILRTTLFLAGIDINKMVQEFRESGRYGYLKGIFNLLSVNQYPDTSSTMRIIASSTWEFVSAISIVSLVPRFVYMYYTRPGTSSDTGPGLRTAVEITVLAAFFTLFALIAAAFTAFSMDEIVRTRRLSNFIPFRSPEPGQCGICLEPGPVTDFVSLQCYSDEDEAAHPQRKLHYFHETCIEFWWFTNRNGAGRCPVCRQTALAYRTVDAEYRYPAPEPSALVWALYSFFACVHLFFGGTSPIATRQFPQTQDSLGEHFGLVLFRAVGGLCLILLSRLFYIKALYTFYLALPKWFNEYPSTRLHKYLKIPFHFFDIKRFVNMVFSGPHVTKYRGWPATGGIPETLMFNLVSALVRQIHRLAGLYRYLTPRQIEYIEYILQWLKLYFSPDLGPAEYWLLRIAIVVLPLIFIHGFAVRVSDLIYAIKPPSLVNNERLRIQQDSLARFCQRMNTLWFGFARLAFQGGGVIPPPRHILLLSPILNGVLIGIIGSSRVGGIPLIAYIKNALEAMGYSPDWASVLLAVAIPPFLWAFCAIFYILYLTVWLTIWEDFFWQMVALTLTHSAAKVCISFLPWRIPSGALQGYDALILTVFFLFPMLSKKVSRAWFAFPHQS